MNDKPKTEIWVCLDKDGYPVFTAGWKEACHEYINDAVLHDKSAEKWVVRQVLELPKKTESVLIEGVAHTLPIEVACKLLRLNIDLQTSQAEVEALRKDAEWQPIETAPKDGSMVLLCRNVEGANPCNYRSVGEWCDDWYWTTDFTDCIDGNIQDTQPTHWMPLPKPPTAIAKDTQIDALGEMVKLSQEMGLYEPPIAGEAT